MTRLAVTPTAAAFTSGPEPVTLSTGASGYLDACRAIAALAVMLGHWRGFCFVEFSRVEPSHLNAAVKLLYTITRFGHSAVMIFFVLSGFFISSSILRNLKRESWSWPDYAIERGARLYVVLIPGLILGAVWDLIGVARFNSSGIYSSPLQPFGDRIPSLDLTTSTFVGNLLFLQTRFVPAFGSNGPLWSLFNEFWFYLVFPTILFTALYARTALLKSLFCLALSLLALWILGNQVGSFAIWLLGAGVGLTGRYLAFRNPKRWSLLFFICAGFCLFAYCLLHFSSVDSAVGVSFALLLHGLVQLDTINYRLKALAKAFAGFSYSLYVLHFPALLLIRAAFFPLHRWQPDLKHLACASVIALLVIIYAFLIARITENYTPQVRRWLKSRFAAA